MKKVILLLALFFGTSFAGNSNGIGFWIGSHGGWGADYKYLTGNNKVWNFYLNDLRFGDNSAVGLSLGHYFVHNLIKADASIGRFPLYWGPHVGFGYWSGGGNGPGSYTGLDVELNLVGGISWFLPLPLDTDVSLELITPGVGHWHETTEQASGGKHTNNSPGFGLKGSLGFRLLFHVYLF
ncbi:MAG: hypothetical protein LBU89_00585 [Fibromonadaceae bacterium]|jgi:hypothetical protein|nr:hypothetical protein [Fibromonadaceae bacterium]